MSESTTERAVGRGIAFAAFLLMAGNLISRILGLVREQLTSGLFGAGNEIAAFTVADNVNTLLFDLMLSGMLEAALVPVLAQWIMPEMRQEFRRISGALLTITAIGLGSMAILGSIFAPTVVRLMTALGGSGDARGAETTELTIDLVRIILPSIVFLGIAAIFMGCLYSLQNMTVPALSSGIRNACIVVALVVLHGSLGIKSLPVGIVVGAVLIAAVQLPSLKRANAIPIPNLHLRHPAVKQVIALYWPISIGLLISTFAVIVDRNLAWGAEEDALGAMRYATTLVQLVMGLVGAAVSLASLPQLSQHANNKDEPAFQATLSRALGLVTTLIVPAVLGLAAISSPAIALLFRHGELTNQQAHSITIALLGYLPGHFFAAFDQIFIFAFYARRNTRTPVIVGMVSTGVYFALALSLVDRYGMIGLVLANSTQFAVHAIVMYWLARSSFGLAHERALWRTMGQCFLAAGIMAGLAFLTWLGLDHAIPTSTGFTDVAREIMLVAIPAGLGAAVYLGLAFKLQIGEVRSLVNGVTGRLLAFRGNAG
ncbi:murein biosynthesis integral membrane protein MurJ [soil metagenome]